MADNTRLDKMAQMGSEMQVCLEGFADKLAASHDIIRRWAAAASKASDQFRLIIEVES